jgi:hypothetical protein
MTHLSPGEIVDVAEGCADTALVAHARDCDACRAKVASVLDALRLAQSDPAPEPSPLFWPHLAARIGAGVRRERMRVPFWRSWGWRLAQVGAVAVVVIAVGLGARMWPREAGSTTPVADTLADAPPPAAVDAAAGAGPYDDPSWVLVIDLSSQVSVEEAEASGVVPPPGDADKALRQLDGGERVELARILREEIAAGSPAVPQGPGD